MNNVLIIGGGIAGTEASKRLTDMGFAVSIVEQSDSLGGKLNKWDTLFPNNRPANELLHKLRNKISPATNSYLNNQVTTIKREGEIFDVSLSNGQTLQANAILLATGFDVFDAHKKEEYGYGIYDNVITSADLELLYKNGKKLKTSNENTPKRICLIHCVGSRDEKAGNSYCSQLCCITAVKQAVKIKKNNPEAEVFCFYMDLRMFGRHFEALYKEAQVQHGIQFIRGRLSECFENSDGSIMLKTEDTLLGKPFRLNTDIVVLMVGMVPSATTNIIKSQLNINTEHDQFFSTSDPHEGSCSTNIPGVFVAGACTGPKTIENTILEANTAAIKIRDYLQLHKVIK